MSSDPTSRSDKELWQRLAMDRDVAPVSVADMEFAAWLEGRLSEGGAARIEAAMAVNPEMRRAALDLSDILGKTLPPAPARMTVRAQALVGFEVERVRAGGGFLSRLFAIGRRHALQRAVMATAVVALAVGGFSVGGGLGESFAHERYSTGTGHMTAVASSDMTNELGEFFTSDGI